MPDRLTIEPSPNTPSLWFYIDGTAYRLDDPRVAEHMGARHHELCLALIRYSTDALEGLDHVR